MKLIAPKHEKGRGDTPYIAVDLMLDKQKSQVSRCLAIINIVDGMTAHSKKKLWWSLSVEKGLVTKADLWLSWWQAENIIYGIQLRLAWKAANQTNDSKYLFY